MSFHVRSMSTYVVVCKTYSNKQPKVLSLGWCWGGGCCLCRCLSPYVVLCVDVGFCGGVCRLLFFKGVVCRCMSMYVDVCRVTSVVSYVAYVVVCVDVGGCYLRI